MLDNMSQKEPSVISWRSIAVCESITDFSMTTNGRRFLPSIKNYLPFQFHIPKLAHKFKGQTNRFTSIISSVTFSSQTDLISPDVLSFKFVHQSLDNLKQIFFADLVLQEKFITFPELAMPIKARLMEFTNYNKDKSVCEDTERSTAVF
jgi:hypothetical protein